MSGWLYLAFIAELSCDCDNRAVNEPLVGGVVDLSEGVVVSAGDSKSGKETDTSEAEEICHVHEGKSVES